ncbi:unnamed protein product [Durusdinium trenchii]|uniref:Peptidase M16 N-terminal domain-containing protein n=2 Tax=Durusdinium trenchii TaxID=1381693 RepID=A0ABP0KAH7_9DINO
MKHSETFCRKHQLWMVATATWILQILSTLAASTPTPCPAAAPALVALPRRGAAALPWVLAEVAKAATEDEEVLSPDAANADSPWNKPRIYKAFRLTNGLRVLLVEDESMEQMDVALTLPFGQFDDPADRPGLAHLTEHLLLSEKDAGEDLETWLETRFGESNGFTAFESALFTLSCEASDWSSALPRFGRCFRAADADASDAADPRFVASSVAREVRRIDGEFMDGLSAQLRSLQLLRCRTVEGHPLRAFGPGSMKTLLPLGDRPEDLQRLAKLSQELFRSVAAENATLAIVAPVPIVQLRPVVADAFAGLAARAPRAAEPRTARSRADPLPAAETVAPCFVVDTKDDPAISFTWSIPFEANSADALDVTSFRASKPLVVLSHLVAHQGPGSLSAWLQRHGWLPENLGPKITAQSPFCTEGFAIWELKIKLSSSGLTNWRRVAACVFGVLAALAQRYVRDALGGPRRDLWRQAVDEVSTLADIAWRFPPRPPLASELANDMRQSKSSKAYVLQVRRLVAREEAGLAVVGRAARFTSSAAQEEATEALGKVFPSLTPRRARLTLATSATSARLGLWELRRRRDENLQLPFGELSFRRTEAAEWLTSGPASWWCAPPLNVYLSRADRINKPKAKPDPKIPESIKSKTGFNGVLWSEACRARLVPNAGASAIPEALWVVPGCVYVSGQFNERVEPLGDEPVVTLTLWLPAQNILDASPRSRAAGRMWLKSLQLALESPFYSAALAGCRWECAFFTTSPSEAGVRFSFQAFSDNLPRFATDAALAIGRHTGPAAEQLEVVRRMALAELTKGAAKGAAARRAEAELKSFLKQLRIEDVQQESQALWRSVDGASSQALVAGAISEEDAAELVRQVVSTLPISPGVTAPLAPLDPGPRPCAVLTRRPSWQGPVAQSLCRASGLPALLDVCGRAMK